ncbi:MAG: hypothetical protein M1818_000240 [Claussenomyces sp. TS43310]|nr:MAG: hypothetical protein M1818_000240 [Claussenomyces sp. TS43310]
MTWLSTTRSIAFYLILPITAIYNILLVLFAPAIHLASYLLHALLAPVKFMGRFETLYIYFGVAALIGIITGSVLHFSSSLLITALGLRPTAEEKTRTAASVREARQQKKLEDSWQTSTRAARDTAARAELLRQEYAEYFDRDRGKRKDGAGLLSQTILEEDDDSDNF